MNTVALIVIIGGSAVSTISGLIVSRVMSRRHYPKEKDVTQRYTLRVERDGKEKAYRIESNTPEAAEAAIRDIIESAER